MGGRAFDHELARTEIAYKIGADRPDEAIKIIEGMKREPRWAARWQAEAFGWLAVALSPRDRARAFGLIDRALAMMIDHRDWAGPDDEMAAAARIAVCARRIGYPDMESVIMRVMAARPGGERNASSDRDRLIAVDHGGRGPAGPDRPRRGPDRPRADRSAEWARPDHPRGTPASRG